MSAEETLIQVRQDKHQQLNGGTYPLATNGNHSPITSLLKVMDSAPHKTTISVEDLSNDPEFLLHGRISALRKSGGITFLKITDTSGSMQLIASKTALSNYAELSLLDLGDLVEIKGRLCLSKTGEKSVLIREWRVLTKCLRPLPEKFLGISDPELKYRQRYLDLISSEESRARFMVRSLILRGIRKIMDGDGFMEVETSTLNAISSGANAKPFITHHNALDMDLRLRIAPELYLKRLLVGGFDKVYEIGRAYRNEGIDTRHNPEFTIMESYQAYADFHQLMDFTMRLLEHIELHCQNESHGLAKEYYLKWKAERTFSFSEFHVVPMKFAVEKAARKAGITLEWNGNTANDLWDVKLWDREFAEQDLSRREKIDEKALLAEYDNASSGERLAILFEYIVEPFLTEDYRTIDQSLSAPVFIAEYPVAVCPLARVNDNNPDVCDRFELFINGMELANGYQELNNPKEQARRFIDQLDNHKDAADFDHDYVEALEVGLPPAVGYGMGLDRLCCLLTGTKSIKDVILFPTLKQAKP